MYRPLSISPRGGEGCWRNVQCSMLNVQCSMLNVQCSMFNAQCSMINVQWFKDRGEAGGTAPFPRISCPAVRSWRMGRCLFRRVG